MKCSAQSALQRLLLASASDSTPLLVHSLCQDLRADGAVKPQARATMQIQILDKLFRIHIWDSVVEFNSSGWRQ